MTDPTTVVPAAIMTISGNTLLMTIPAYTVPAQTIAIDIPTLADVLKNYFGQASSEG